MALRPPVNSKNPFHRPNTESRGFGVFLLIVLSFNLLLLFSLTSNKPYINKVMFSVATNIYNTLQIKPTNYTQPPLFLLYSCTFVQHNPKHEGHRDPLDFFSKRNIFKSELKQCHCAIKKPQHRDNLLLKVSFCDNSASVYHSTVKLTIHGQYKCSAKTTKCKEYLKS